MAYGDYETYNRDISGGRAYASQADRHMEVDLKCPNCMGERDIDVNNMVLVCPYCDSKQILSEYEMEAYCRLKGITPPVKVAPPVYNNMPNETIVMREYVPNPQPVISLSLNRRMASLIGYFGSSDFVVRPSLLYLCGSL